jgi:hypothetical protein
MAKVATKDPMGNARERAERVAAWLADRDASLREPEVERDERDLPSMSVILATVRASTRPTGTLELEALDALDPLLRGAPTGAREQAALVLAVVRSALRKAAAEGEPAPELERLAAAARGTARVDDDRNRLTRLAYNACVRLREVARGSRDPEWVRFQIERQHAHLRRLDAAFGRVSAEDLATLAAAPGTADDMTAALLAKAKLGRITAETVRTKRKRAR